MTNRNLLRLSSIFIALFATLHFAQDDILGFSPGGPWNIVAIVVIAVFLCGPLLLAERAIGRVLMLLIGFGGILGSAIHFQGKGVGTPGSKSEGAFFFAWCLYAMGVIGVLCAILSVREMLGAGRRQEAVIDRSTG